MPTAEEKQMKVSKEVKKVREFEARLLSSYQKYLQKLEKIMKCTLRPTPNRHSHPLPARFFAHQRSHALPPTTQTNRRRATKRRMSRSTCPTAFWLSSTLLSTKTTTAHATWVAVLETYDMNNNRCMAELLRSVPHFNFTWNIISLLVPYLASNNAEFRYLISRIFPHLLLFCALFANGE